MASEKAADEIEVTRPHDIKPGLRASSHHFDALVAWLTGRYGTVRGRDIPPGLQLRTLR